MPNVSRNPQSGCFSTEDPVSQQETCSLYFLILSLQSTPLSSNRHLQDVFSFGRWWVGLYHVWSSGNTGVFCGVAQVSQCGSLSTRVRQFPFCVCPFSPSCFLQVIKKSIAPCSFFTTDGVTHSSLTGVAQFVWARPQACAKCALTADARSLCQLAEISKIEFWVFSGLILIKQDFLVGLDWVVCKQ